MLENCLVEQAEAEDMKTCCEVCGCSLVLDAEDSAYCPECRTSVE